MTPSGRPELVPTFPVASFVPASKCPHHGPYPAGSVLCCMVCHKSGMDGADVMQIDPRELPKPEPPPVQLALPAPAKPKAGKASGKMHRRKLRRKALQPQTQTA